MRARPLPRPRPLFRQDLPDRGVEKRLRGEGGDPVIQIQTPFGGGKTHALIAMYHRAAAWIHPGGRPLSPPRPGGELTSAHPQVAWLERNEPGDKPPSSSKTRTWSSSLLGYRVMRVSTNPDLLKERHRDTMSIGSVKSLIGRHCSENLQNMRFFGALLQPYSV